MSSFFKKLGNSLGQLADLINGSNTDEPQVSNSVETRVETPVPTSDKQKEPIANTPGPQIQHDEEKNKSQEDIFNNAIDKRYRAIKQIADTLEHEGAVGSHMVQMEKLRIGVVVDAPDFKLTQYSWADDELRNRLRQELDNRYMTTIGKKLIEINFYTAEELPKSFRQVIPNCLYYSFAAAPKEVTHTRARISVMEGTGSLAQKEYIIDTSESKLYCIGRGNGGMRDGRLRTNHIKIADNDPNAEIQSRNNRVSSFHANIVARNGKFFLQAERYGCRPHGGACTKIVTSYKQMELKDTAMYYPLNHSDMIELGQSVYLLYEIL